MKVINYDYIIVGTGLSGLGVIHKLSNTKKKILILDSNNKILKKSFKNSQFCEEGLPIPIKNKVLGAKKMFLNLFNYKVFGGHTNFWGGYCVRFDKDDFKKWPLKLKDLKNYYYEAEKLLKINYNREKIHSIIKYKNNDFKLRNALISEKNKVFNSKKIIKKILKKKNIKIEFINLNKFEYSNELFYLSNNNKVFAKCKNLILCAGPYNTQEIIFNSLKIKKAYPILQSQSFLIPAISLFTEKKNIRNYQLFINKNKFYKHRIYFEIKKNYNLTKTILEKKYNLFSKFIPKFLIKKTYIIWGFLPSSLSFNYEINNSKIKYLNKSVYKRKNVHKTLDLYLDFIEKNLKFKLLKKLLKINQFGRSYHLGCNFPMRYKNKKNNFLNTNSYGKIIHPKIKNLFVVGTSNFPDLPSNSPGLTVLANGLRIGDYLKND